MIALIANVDNLVFDRLQTPRSMLVKAELQAKRKTSDLAEIECYELLSLFQIYQFAQLRKSEAIAESTK